MRANISSMKLDANSWRDFKLWQELDGNLHPERQPGCHWISTVCHGEGTEGQAAVGNVEFGSGTNLAPAQEIALGEKRADSWKWTLAQYRKKKKPCRIRISPQHNAYT